MPQTTRKRIRTLIRYAFYAGCVVVVVSPIIIIGYLANSLNEWMEMEDEEPTSEYVSLSAVEAQALMTKWPDGVELSDVHRVSLERNFGFDSYYKWYRIELEPGAAEKWADHVHDKQAINSLRLVHSRHQGMEGVHRIVNWPARLNLDKSVIPSWWSPATIEFRSTEAMFWHAENDSVLGRATYSAFNKAKDTLWIFEFSSEHAKLWNQGEVPSGSVFSTID